MCARYARPSSWFVSFGFTFLQEQNNLLNHHLWFLKQKIVPGVFNQYQLTLLAKTFLYFACYLLRIDAVTSAPNQQAGRFTVSSGFKKPLESRPWDIAGGGKRRSNSSLLKKGLPSYFFSMSYPLLQAPHQEGNVLQNVSCRANCGPVLHNMVHTKALSKNTIEEARAPWVDAATGLLE